MDLKLFLLWNGVNIDVIPEVAYDKSARYLWELGIEKMTGCEIMNRRPAALNFYGAKLEKWITKPQ